MTPDNIFEIIVDCKKNNHHRRTARHRLMNIKTESEEEKNKLYDLVSWLSTNGDDILGLVKIVMSLVNSEEIGGAYKKKEARLLFREILELMDVDEDAMDFYLKIFESGVEVIIWAKNGGLSKIVEKGGCFPSRKKNSKKKK